MISNAINADDAAGKAQESFKSAFSTAEDMSPELNIDQLIKAAKMPQRTIPVCVRGDLTLELQELQAQLEEKGHAGNPQTLAGVGDAGIRKQVEEIIKEMKRFTVNFILRALPDDQFNDLKAQHPPRVGVDEYGYNEDTFHKALFLATLTHPDITEQQWDDLRVNLSRGQTTDLYNAAFNICHTTVSIPFA